MGAVMRAGLLTVTALMALGGAPLRAAGEGVRVVILDAPGSVLLSTPAPVLYAIENRGSTSVLLPVNDTTHGVDVRSDGTDFVQHRNAGCPQGDAVRLLLPGERLLAYEDVGDSLGHEGPVEVRATLRGSGTCFLAPEEGHRLGALQLGPKQLFWAPFVCWEGEVISEPRTIIVTRASATVDIAALEYIRGRMGGLPLPMKLRLMREVRSEFPTSAYAFAAALWGGQPKDLEEVITLQPSHPLVGYARTLRAERQLYEQRRCGGSPPDAANRVDLRTLDVTPAAREYLQAEATKWNQECPPSTTPIGDDNADESR